MEKIVITGMGTVNPLGLNLAETWKNLINGVSGVGPITQFNTVLVKSHDEPQQPDHGLEHQSG